MTTTPQNKPAKAPQARCSGCNHPESFHRKGPCMVMGCTCKTWNGPKIPRKSERS